MRAANSWGVAAQVPAHLRAAWPSGRRARGSARTRTSASASAAGRRLDEQAVSPSATTSGIPPTRLPTTARPRQNASTRTRPSPSERDGRTSSVAASRAACDLARRQTRSAPLDPLRPAGAGSEPEPTTCSRASGTRRRTAATPRRARRSPCSARARRRRARSAVSGNGYGRAEERLEVHEGRELGVGLAAGCAHEPGRVARDRADGVGTAEPDPRKRVRERIEQPPQPASRTAASARASRRGRRRSPSPALGRAPARAGRARSPATPARARRPAGSARSSRATRNGSAT